MCGNSLASRFGKQRRRFFGGKLLLALGNLTASHDKNLHSYREVLAVLEGQDTSLEVMPQVWGRGDTDE